MYDRERADDAVAFIRSLKHTKGRWAGVPFTLLDWQEQIIRDIFGTIKEDGYRQYKTAYIEIPKKNGKSELAAAVALYLLFADDEPAAEIYSAAADRQQAAIVFNVAATMVRNCPALAKRCKIIDSIKRIVVPGSNSFYQVLSSEVPTKHGLNVHGVVFDELHARPDRKLYDVLTDGSGDARTQPLFFLITTAGDDPDRVSIGWEVHSYAKAVLDGTKVDPTFYAVIYGVDDEEANWLDEDVWRQVNPALGHTIQIETVRESVVKTIDNPAKERTFRQIRLNQWVKTKVSKWLSLDRWDATAGMVVPEKLKGRKCYGGLDLSSSIDLTAYCLLFPPIPEDEPWRALWWFWIPEESMKARVERDKVPYDRWVKQGFIKTTPGNVIDNAFIRREVVASRDLYDIQEIGFDPWAALQLSLDLTDDGLTMAEVRQGYKSMSPAMKEIQKIIMAGQLAHGGNPVARWCFGNLEVKQDENENIRPVKGKSTQRIDGFVALVNAGARATLHEHSEGQWQFGAV